MDCRLHKRGTCDASLKTQAGPYRTFAKSFALLNKGLSGCTASKKCGNCEGDCDADADCQAGLKCLQRDGKAAVKGCTGGGKGDVSGYDFCVPADKRREANVSVVSS